MNLKSVENCEEKKLERFMNFKLPHKMKVVGWSIMLISLAVLLATKLFEGEFFVLKDVLRRVILLGLLIVVISKEQIEDERIQLIRSKAFSFTFLAAVVYVLVQPVITFLVASIIKPEKAVIEDMGDFVIVWFLLMIYLLVFYLLKRKG